MNLYSIDVALVATLYVKAKSLAKARKIAEDMKGSGFELPVGQAFDTLDEGLCVCGVEFLSPALPNVSISPAITFTGPFPDDDLCLVEANVPESRR